MDYVEKGGASIKNPPNTTTIWESPIESPLPNEHAIASTLLELIAVDITRQDLMEEESVCFTSSPLYDFDAIEIYGHIILIDDLDNEFFLFNREQGESKPIFPEDNTSFCLNRYELGSPRCLPSTFWLELNLKLKADHQENTVEIKAREFVDSTSRDYDTPMMLLAYNHSNVVVELKFIIFQCAMLTCVGVVVEKINVEDVSDDSNSGSAELSGMISATYKTWHESYVFHELFNDGSKPLEFGDFTTLSTFAVPAYTTLEVQVNAEVNGDKIISDGALKFDTQCMWRIWFEKQIRGRKYMIRLIMSWGHAIKILPENKIREWCDVRRLSRFRDVSEKHDKKRPRSRKSRNQCRILKSDQPIYIQPSLQSLSKRKWIISVDPVELVEIFSISVYLNGGSGSMALKGVIFGYDNLNELELFKGGYVSSTDIVELVDLHRCFTGSFFGITMELEDSHGGHEISNGCVGYDFSTIRDWYNRRICSIVRGKHGFAALHYTIFRDSVQATLKFMVESSILGPATDSFQVNGSIYTMYSNFRYSTHYEKKYYISTLFEKNNSNAVKLRGVEIPLSKSAVAVPLNAALIVVANVHVSSYGNGKHLDTLKFEGIFNSVKPKKFESVECQPEKVHGSKFCLSVYVEWVDEFPPS